MSRTVFSYALEEQFHFCKHARSTKSLNIDCKLVISIMILSDICGKHLVIVLTSHVGQLIELGVTHLLQLGVANVATISYFSLVFV